jgi:N-methylhydantoinase B
VLHDVRAGFVSRASARQDYGVVLTEDGRAVNLEATRALRSQRPATKLFHRNDYVDAVS